jgi:hypothetical protein
MGQMHLKLNHTSLTLLGWPAADCYVVAGGLVSRDEDGFATVDCNPGGREDKSFERLLTNLRTADLKHSGGRTPDSWLGGTLTKCWTDHAGAVYGFAHDVLDIVS